MHNTRNFSIAVDTGGTFTDCIAREEPGKTYRRKVLSSGALRSFIHSVDESGRCTIGTNWELSRDIFKGYEFRLLGSAYTSTVLSFDPETRQLQLADSLPDTDFPAAFELTAREEAPILAARLITQTALDEAFPPIVLRLGTTKGTNALLEGKGARTAFFVSKGFKDLLRIGDQSRPELFALHVQKPEPLHTEVVEIEEIIDTEGKIIQEINLDELPDTEAESIAICLKNSYKNSSHEEALAKVLRKKYPFVSVSTELSPQVKFLPRAETAVVNAYLSPIIHRYLNQIVDTIRGCELRVMTSAGNLMQRASFEPKDSLLSGPAGGVVGAADLAIRAGYTKLITFDMGGTSTDVARYDGDFDYQYESRIGNARLQSPALAIHTVAAGGGSICGFDGYRLVVGPESAGAYPGPACYGAGGPLTITDINLLLNRLDTGQFSIPVSREKAEIRLNELLQQMQEKTGERHSATEVLEGFIRIANEIMAEAVRKISVAKGVDPADYALVAFGGAGGLHACELARLLHIQTILLPGDAGLLSAYGISKARIERFAQQTVLQPMTEETVSGLQQTLERVEAEARIKLKEEGISEEESQIRKRLLFLRLRGQESSLEIETTATLDTALVRETFRQQYETIYGYFPENRAIEVESIRVIAQQTDTELVDTEIQNSPENRLPYQSIVSRETLQPGDIVTGPCILTDAFATTYLEQGATARKRPDQTLVIELSTIRNAQETLGSVVELELFTNRFRAIADHMGEMLQRTSLSVNVKERLDFSCALLDASGELIANAPHIPVHLGSLGVCVRKVREAIRMEPGDVVVTNHPGYGGSHLPDVTLITPVFAEEESTQLLGYVASRCHHAEMGGIRPASMPPNARNLGEEGVVIPPMYLVKNHETQWEQVREVLTNGPYPSRSVEENLADLNAALAANREGARGLQTLARLAGVEKVHAYMEQLKTYSALRIRERLQQIPAGTYQAQEFLDDDTKLQVAVEVQDSGSIRIDFTGSGPTHRGNLNANEAIVQSVVVYVLRTLISENIPLNDGLLRPVQLVIPEHTILRPAFPDDPFQCPAVVGGNVETSQRLTDTLLKAFGVLACSQGTMNNVLFGNATFGYYETIGGGTGAGEGFHGASGVHHHMTNTRITDPEIMEWRYPVRLETFEIREHSGGNGQYRGGDGIRRKIRFLAPVSLSVLTQHRINAPYGLHGGGPGAVGKQWVERQNGELELLAGIDGKELHSGDTLIIETPGGGGWGTPVSE